MPGQSLRYTTVQIPQDHPPGLYWYHTHPHGESHRQALDGMSGALVIEGIESYFPPLVGLARTRPSCAWAAPIVERSSVPLDLKQRVETQFGYLWRGARERLKEIFTVNGSVQAAN